MHFSTAKMKIALNNLQINNFILYTYTSIRGKAGNRK